MRYDSKASTRLVGLLWVGAFLAAALPSAADTPYQGIAGRNAFRLTPFVPIPPSPQLKPPLRKVGLIGMLTILDGKRQVILRVAPGPAAPAKPGQAAEQQTEHSYMLAEGQRLDGITVLRIDEKVRLVNVDNDGTLETLTFPDESKKAAAR
jgi:hypothetical protein